jgi:flagellar FliL protein
MSAAAVASATDAVPPKKGKKKLLIFVALAVLLLGGGGGAALYVMKKRAAEAAAAAEAEEGDGEAAAEGRKAHAKAPQPGSPPAFLPLEPFVVNLADRDADRFAQVGITLELDDAKAADALKPYMPAIRNGILMILAHKTSAELHDRSGKEKLAGEIARAAVRPMGIEIDEPDAHAEAGGAEDAKKSKKKKAKDAPANPVRNVLFSSFIIQ